MLAETAVAGVEDTRDAVSAARTGFNEGPWSVDLLQLMAAATR